LYHPAVSDHRAQAQVSWLVAADDALVGAEYSLVGLVYVVQVAVVVRLSVIRVLDHMSILNQWNSFSSAEL
jgi:hypothetical protein